MMLRSKEKQSIRKKGIVWRKTRAQALGATEGFCLPDLENDANFSLTFYTRKRISAAHNLMPLLLVHCV